MKPTTDEITFVIYNNRSVDGVVMNFLLAQGFDLHKLTDLEQKFAWCDSQWAEVRTIEVAEKDLNLEYADITYGPEDLAECTDLVNASIAAFYLDISKSSLETCKELIWLRSRGIEIDSRYEDNSKLKLGSLSYIVEHATPRQLEVLGITCHPMLTNILDDDLSGGGILIPLFRDNKLVNMTIRRISDVGKLKYTQSCPDISVWGLDDIVDNHPVWMTEGIFDMDAINESVSPFSSSDFKQAVSVSSAMWSVPQLMQLMDKAGKFINIFADNDKVGLRTAAIMKKFLEMNGFVVRIYISKTCKDPSEHFVEKNLGWDDVVEIEVTPEMVEQRDDMSFNFLKYLKNRKF